LKIALQRAFRRAATLARAAAIGTTAVMSMLIVTAHAQHRERVELPAAWKLDGNQLLWTSSVPLRMGGARYEFRAGDHLLGYPVQRGNLLRLSPLPVAADLERLSVWAGGRRIDVEPSHRPIESAPIDEPELATLATDVASKGPYRTQRLAYQLRGLRIEGYPAPVEVLAEVTTPTGTSGPMPLVLFLHGRHSTCYRGGTDGEPSGDWPCPTGWRPVPSHTGYRYITDVLASQGYLTVSISANGINAQDGVVNDGGASARSQLIRHHLALWAEWSAVGGDPWGGRFLGRVDTRKLVLVGHSRGGEGVERATIDSNAEDPWQVRGLVLIGPTAFGRQVAPGVHTTVILPFCDGDVTDLEGQQYVDIGRDLTRDRALRASIMAMGTNHNFYNTEWTPGLSKSPAWDDWFDPGDPQCGDTRRKRLTPIEQQAVGLTYTAALVDLVLADDRASLPVLDGTPVKPSSIGRAATHVHAIGGDRQLLYAAGAGIRVTAQGLTAAECRGFYAAGPFDLRAGCTPGLFFELLPHWLPMPFMETAAAPRALNVAWQQAGGSVLIPIDRDLSDAAALDFRIAGVPAAASIELTVRLRDTSGRSTDLALGPARVRSYRGPSPLGKVEARQVRASLEGVTIDLRNVASIELIPRSVQGRFWLLDVSSSRQSLTARNPIRLPRVSVGNVVVPEGDSGQVTVDVPIRIEGPVTHRARLWVQFTDYANFARPARGFPLVIEPGATSASVPLTYEADVAYNPFPQLTQVTLLAQKNAVTGDYGGSVLVREDDPAPILTVDAKRVTAAEGSALEWTFHLSAAMTNPAFYTIELRSPAGSLAELDSDDLPGSFLEQICCEPPIPAVPLSQLGILFGIEFPAGVREAKLTIPIDADARTEAAEGIVLRLDGFGDPVVPRPIEMIGLVPAN